MAIHITSIHKSFHGRKVLKDVSFSLADGEKASLIGPGGSGKSLILKILLGLMAPDGGEVSLLGINPYTAEEKVLEATIKKIGMAFQQGGLFDFMNVRDNLIFAMEHMTPLTQKQMDEKIRFLLDAVKLGRTELMFPYELSGGMKRRVGIARALCTDPILAVFDEPTSGLDPVTSSIILQMIDALSAIEGQILLMATSNVEIAVRFAKRVILLSPEGEVAADGPWDELLIGGSPWVRHFLGTRFLGLDLEYVRELKLPEEFIAAHWT